MEHVFFPESPRRGAPGILLLLRALVHNVRGTGSGRHRVRLGIGVRGIREADGDQIRRCFGGQGVRKEVCEVTISCSL